jgi:hypothetical protein
MRQIELEFVELNKKVVADILPEKNPELCDLLWDHLPYTTIQTHALVSGDHLYHIAPIVELVTTKAAYKEDRTKSPDGTIFLSQLQHMAIKYGTLSEYLPAAPVARVIPEHIATLKEVGEGCWDGIFRTKQYIEVRVSRVGQPRGEFYFPVFETQHPLVRALVDEIRAQTLATWLAPPPEVLAIHEGRIKSGAGSRGQYFATMVFVNGETRPLGYSAYGGLMQICKKPETTLDTLKQITPHFIRTPAEFIGYCGMDSVWSFTQRLLGLLSEIDTKEDYFAMASAMSLYVNQLNAWNLHYFPWASGQDFKHR